MEDLVNSLVSSARDKEAMADRFKKTLSYTIFNILANLFPREEVNKIPADKRNEVLTYAFLKCLPENEREAFKLFIHNNLDNSFIELLIKENREHLHKYENRVYETQAHLIDLYTSHIDGPPRGSRYQTPVITRAIPPGDETLNPSS